MTATRRQVIGLMMAARNEDQPDTQGRGAVLMDNVLWTSRWVPGGTLVAEWWSDDTLLINPEAVSLPLTKAIMREVEQAGLNWVVRPDDIESMWV